MVNDPAARDSYEHYSISVRRHLIEQGLCYTFRASTVVVSPRVTQGAESQIDDERRSQATANGKVCKGGTKLLLQLGLKPVSRADIKGRCPKQAGAALE